MTDATEQIQYLHTLSQISRSCLDELTKENERLKKEIQQLREESKARDDTLSCLHVITKENERLKKENERHEKVMEIIDGAIKSPLPRQLHELPPHQYW